MSFKAMLIAVVIAASQTVSADDDAPLVLYGAGSLKASLSDVVAAYEEATGHEVRTAFGPSDLMRQRIESGELAHVFASANMAHPEKLQADGRAGPVRLFARNKLCAIAQDDIEVTEDTLLEIILRPDVRLGTSTPGADYGLTVLDGAPGDAENLADFILAPEAQSILESYGFEPATAGS